MSSEIMMRVLVRFLDDEAIAGTARNLSFDEPDFLLDVGERNPEENNQTAWVPLTSIKMVEFPTQATRPRAEADHKVAIRFLDGEVLKGHIGKVLDRHRHGIMLDLYPEDGAEPSRRLGIPFSAIKAIFYLREFDGRSDDAKGTPSEAYLARRTMAPLLGVLEEMDMLTRLRDDGILSDTEYHSKRNQVLEQI